jgi:2-haloalkanoic acid dehalogenase type II
MKRRRVKKIAFGWFGTLMDHRPGMQETLTRLEGPQRGKIDLEAMAADWDAAIVARGRGKYEPWPILALHALSEVAGRYGVEIPETLDGETVQGWVPHWPLFADQSALGRIGRRFKCAVLSQLDKATLAPCLPSLARVMDSAVTSDLSRSYKPSPQYFKLLRVQLHLRERDHLLVVSADRETDLDPAAAEGYQTLWVDRTGEGDGVPDLHAVAALLW